MIPDTYKKIDDLCTLINGNGFKPHEWSERGYPIIRIQNLNGSREFNYYAQEPKEKWIIRSGDLLFAWAGVKGVSFGPTIWNGPTGVLNQHIYKIVPNDGVNKLWLYSALNIITSQIESKAHGFKSSLLHVHKSDITDQLIRLPPFLEQCKIAEVLGVWDESIDLLERLIGRVRSRKQGLMQQLLTGKKRFKEFEGSEWRTVKLKDISTINYGKSPKNIFSNDGAFPVYGTGGITGYTSTHIHNGESVIIGRKGTIDKVRYVTGKFWAIDTTYYLECKEIAQVKWVYYFLSSANLAELNEASGVPSLNRDTLYAIKFKIPSLPEQEKIAAVLSAADEEISTIEKQLAAYKQQKLGLMQQLLTGRIRI